MRNLCRMYQNVFFLDVQEDICDVLVGMQEWFPFGEAHNAGLDAFFSSYAREKVYPSDRTRFLAFADVRRRMKSMLD